MWPDQIKGYLQRQHKVSCKQVEKVGEQVRSWAGVLYPRARPRLRPESGLAGDQIYAYARAYLITPPPQWSKLQGIGGVRFPTSD